MTQPSGAPSAESAFDFEYPDAERLDLIDEIHGTPIADPYRWLEDPDDPRTVEWSARQDALYAAWVGRRLGSDVQSQLRRRLAELAEVGSVTVPVWRGSRCFLTRRGPGQEHPVLYVLDTDGVRAPDAPNAPGGTERELIDPAVLDPSGATTLDGWFPSTDGTLLAYFLSVGGTERPQLRVMRTVTGADIDGPIDEVASHDLAWLPDNAGFYYQRRPTPEQIASGILHVHVLVYLHLIGTPSSQDVLISRPELGGLPASSWFTPIASADGRRLRLDAEWGMAANDVYLADLTVGTPEAPEFTHLKSGSDAKTDVYFGHDGRLYAHTFADAPNGRLCVIDPRHPEYEHWHTLLPEDPEAVLKGFTILDGAGMARPQLLALWSRHALSELTRHDLETGRQTPGHPETGEPSAGSAVQLPGLGTVRDLAGHPDGGPFAYFTYTDFRTPPSVYRFDGRSGAVEQWAPAPGADSVRANTETRAEMHVGQVSYRSYDGTEVRMFILSPTDHTGERTHEHTDDRTDDRNGRHPQRPRPTILYGYGAHGNSRVPAFNPLQVAWVEAGGVYAIANIRGGGEEGESWHRAGVREHRQNTFADFHAAADYLVDQGWTTRDRLGLHGSSAGGQMVGVVLTQQPEAYRAALCSAPQLDMIRAELAGAAALWTRERGTARDPEEFGWLLAQSPYHMLREGTGYPAMLLTVFEGDARVATWHARKFAAAVQRATSAAPAERPILLRREAGVGHTTRAASRLTALWGEQLGFLAAQLGLADPSGAG